LADYNADGHVEQADLDLVLLHWGQPAVPAPNGWFNDVPKGSIDQAELDELLLNWGSRVTPPGRTVSAAVPEPVSMVILSVAALAILAIGRARCWPARQT
jgi:hypothetical protein